MTQQTKADIIRHFRKPYGRVRKAEKSRILDVVVETSGIFQKRAIAGWSGRAEEEAYALLARRVMPICAMC